MRISHNIAALNTYRQLTGVNNAATKSLEKLSSGYRINRAGDDAAGLAISEKMRGQIRGLEMATKNAQDGISLIQTAEGALNETHSILQRMRELAVQAANDTNTDVDRLELQKEVDQLAEELTRIANNTEFNTQKLLDGSFTGKFHIGANAQQSLEITIGKMSSDVLGVGEKFTVSGTAIKNEDGSVIYKWYDKDAVIHNSGGGFEAVKATKAGYYAVTDQTTSGATVIAQGTAVLRLEVASAYTDDDSVWLGIDITSQTAADSAITTINNAIETVSAERSKLGAIQNRLEHTINNLGTSAENLTAAESRIRDVDMAKEMMEFTKNNIISQAATAMLAQANMMPQMVLQLLQ